MLRPAPVRDGLFPICPRVRKQHFEESCRQEHCYCHSVGADSASDCCELLKISSLVASPRCVLSTRTVRPSRRVRLFGQRKNLPRRAIALYSVRPMMVVTIFSASISDTSFYLKIFRGALRW